MGWFHKTLKDMQKAINEERWEDARNIAKEHQDFLYKDEVGRELDLATVFLSDYKRYLGNCFGILSKRAGRELRIPKGGQIVTLKVSAKQAIEAIHRFEEVIDGLKKKGKLSE